MSSGARFACQLALPAIGPEGQARLRAARCGVRVDADSHAAAWALAYLAAAGVGHLALGGDVAGVVGLDEATRHPLLHVVDAGWPRGEAYATRLRAQAPDVEVSLDEAATTLHVPAGDALAAGATAAAAYLLATAAGSAP